VVTETPNPFQAGGRLTIARRTGTPEQVATAEANLAEAKIAQAIKRNLAAAPPLNTEQLRRLRGLLGGAR
jgi:hypothetical protein